MSPTRLPTPPLALAAAVIVLAALARVLPHPPNFTPIEAMALFGGAMLAHRGAAIVIVLGAMLLSDLVIGAHALQPLVYLCLAAMVLLGRWVGPAAAGSRVLLAGLASGLGFWLVTNFAVWAGGGGYSPDLAGLLQCYTLALPFLRNSLAAIAVYGLILFGSVHLWRWWSARAALARS